jgi:peptidoglycan/LPS O-acetylase OafA/YrhL
MFVVGAYICSLPATQPGDTIPWHPMLRPIFGSDSARYWHEIGAILVVTAVLHSGRLQVWFASQIGRFLGKISFTLYLIHVPIMCTFTAWLALAVRPAGHLAVFLICGPITFIVVMAIAWILSDPIDGGAVRLSRATGRLWTRIFGARKDVALSEG